MPCNAVGVVSLTAVRDQIELAKYLTVEQRAKILSITAMEHYGKNVLIDQNEVRSDGSQTFRIWISSMQTIKIRISPTGVEIESSLSEEKISAFRKDLVASLARVGGHVYRQNAERIIRSKFQVEEASEVNGYRVLKVEF